MNPAAILTLISDLVAQSLELQERVKQLEQENAQLREGSPET